MTNSQAIQFNNALSTILTEGLTAIKESLTRDRKSLNNGYSHYSELHGLFDELYNMLQDPLEYLQEILGCYIEDLEEEALEDLNNVEKAILLLGKNQEMYKEVNDLLIQMLPQVTEYKVLKEELDKALGEH